MTAGQVRKIHMALKQKGLHVALVEYEGEQHGFRTAESIKFTLEQYMVFFARLMGNFTVADEISPNENRQCRQRIQWIGEIFHFVTRAPISLSIARTDSPQGKFLGKHKLICLDRFIPDRSAMDFDCTHS